MLKIVKYIRVTVEVVINVKNKRKVYIWKELCKEGWTGVTDGACSEELSPVMC
jgi:hypothetical protein